MAILACLEQGSLFARFAPGESWQDERNAVLVAEMPPVWRCPDGAVPRPGETAYQAFVGRGAAFALARGTAFRTFLDGTSRTILVSEAAEAVPWTRPKDMKADPPEVAQLAVARHQAGFNGLFGDGSVRQLKSTMRPTELRAIVTRAGGEAD